MNMDLEQMIKTFGINESDLTEIVEYFDVYRMEPLPSGVSREDLPVSVSNFGTLLDDMGFSLTEAELLCLINKNESPMRVIEFCMNLGLIAREKDNSERKQKRISQIKLDPNRVGYILLSNFLMNGAKPLFDNSRITEETAKQVFDLMDHDRDKMVTMDDLKRTMKMFGEELPNYYVKEMLKEVDIDGDDMISYDEFLFFTTGLSE